jgi:hypothetical protein
MRARSLSTSCTGRKVIGSGCDYSGGHRSVHPLAHGRVECRSNTGRTHLHAYSMLDMKVAGAVVLGVSITYATTAGSDDAIASVIIAPEADHVKISICPGVSRMM